MPSRSIDIVRGYDAVEHVPYELPAWAEEMGNFHRLVSVAMSERKEYNFRWSKSEVEFHILTRR